MTPSCCKKCPSLTKGGRCKSNQTECQKWREWFHEEWTGIQKAAEKLKTRKGADKPIEKRRTVCVCPEKGD